MQSNTFIKQGWLRVVIFLLLYLLLIILGATMLGLFLQDEKADSQFLPVYDSIVLNFVLGCLLVFVFKKLIDRQRFKSIGLHWKGFGKERIAGFFTGLLLIALIAMIFWVMNLLQWFTVDTNMQQFGIATAILLLVAFVEEFVFRGYVLGNLMQSVTKEKALFLSAILFAVFHSLNPNFNLLAFINIFIAGFLLGVNYIYTRNLWFSIFFHFAWNFFQGVVLGFGVSGIALPSLLQQNLRGSILLTGGVFGLEASWLTTIVMSIAAIILFYVFKKKYANEESANEE